MFEIFLFINPIGIYCFDIEKRIQDAIKELDIDDVCYHFVPITNVEIIQDDIIRRRRDNQKIYDISSYSLTASQALEDYHAIKIAYGNKKARDFVFNLQQQLSDGRIDFSVDILTKVMQEQNLNIKRIQSLRSSDFIQESIKQDQKLARQWKIQKTPTTIIFDENQTSDSGILLEGLANQDDLISLFIPGKKVKHQKPDLFSCHLRLV